MGFSNHKNITQDSVFWAQGLCVSCSNLQCVFTKETASPAVLIGRDCLCSLPMTLRARRWCAGRSAVLQLPDPLPPAVWQKPGATASSPAPTLTAIFYHHRQNPRLPSSRETWMSTQMTHLILCPHISLTFSSPLTFSCKLPFSPTPSVPSWTYPQQK